MRAMVYRGPYRIRVEEKDIPPIEHPNDAIVRVTVEDPSQERPRVRRTTSEETA